MALDHVIVSNNAGGDRAGGISCRHGMYTASLTLTQSVVSANTLGLAGGGGVKGGGGIYANCALRITDSTIAGNSAHPGSGDIYYLAGGIFLESSDARMVNTTISGNAAMLSKKYAAGALSVNSSDLSVLTVLTNCTVSGNAATATPPGMASPALAVGYIADGIHVGTGNTGSVLLYNSIVAGNGAGADLVVVNGSASAGYSLLGAALSGSYAGNGNVFSDMPLLAPLNDNGGPTPTRALTPGSPALNVGDPALALSLAGAPLNYDQRGRGFPRTLGDTIDIGAFQHVGPDRIFADGNEPEP